MLKHNVVKNDMGEKTHQLQNLAT